MVLVEILGGFFATVDARVYIMGKHTDGPHSPEKHSVSMGILKPQIIYTAMEHVNLVSGLDIVKDTITELIQAWDTAFSTKTSADYSVCLTAGRGVRGYYFIDLFRARMEYPDLLASAKALYQQYQHRMEDGLDLIVPSLLPKMHGDICRHRG